MHGLSSNARTWIELATALAATGASVLAVDQRSHGRSERTEDGYDFATYAADIAGLVSQWDRGPAVLAGQSWGGNVVVETAHLYPTGVAAVVGVDGGFITLKDRFSEWEECARALAPPRFGAITVDMVRSHLTAMHPDWSPVGIEGTLANFAVEADGSARPNLSYDDHMRILRSLFDHRPSQGLATLSMPSLAVAARPSMADADAVEAAGFDTVVWIEGDHDLHVQQPERIARLIEGVSPWV